MENLFSRPSSKLRLSTNQKIAVAAAAAALIWAVRQPWFPLQINLKSANLASPSPSNPSVSSSPSPDSLLLTPYSNFWEVSLDTDQTFYGRLDPKAADKGQYLKLTDVFYYQPGVSQVKADTIRLVQVGTELHQPKNEVYLNRTHVVAKQPLSPDSKVVKAIEDYQNK